MLENSFEKKRILDIKKFLGLISTEIFLEILTTN